MSQIMKGFLGVFLVMFLVVSSVGILSAFLTVMDAQDLHARVINEMENSNYSREVISENFEKAENAGYELEVVLYYEDGEQASCTGGEEIPDHPGEISLAQVNLKFPFRVGFFGINDQHTLSGYAR